MAARIFDIMPDTELLLSLEPEELAGVVLEYLNASDKSQLNRHNFGLPHTVAGYPREKQPEVTRVLMEAWSWLEREGMIAHDPGSGGLGSDWVFITRRGQQMKRAADLKAYQRAALLPRQLLHPSLAPTVVAPFIRGDYDTAIFQAFKEVEVAVRAKGNFADTDIGVKLMRKAFDASTGPLRDPSIVDLGEREATAHLFAGAVGSFKNPQSHRHVPIDDPAECVELLLMASHLLRIVDARTPIP